ncbi:hypothetical protein FHS95_000142 [Sphingomonas naasensis]|uniref:Uncharacterized protein n=1 Tax=Sphingomonas naasensis TaxID=1344951 RepID=A0A4S1WRV7_9SPHN|nr:hypothetical protein [Sphingomonas naasensis]NIJ18473.1 hypothetical protein [Sphingomonas naasensis]TGX45733.1 hypothetical protein E5A74_00690 [Sphingomonas naasensis]
MNTDKELLASEKQTVTSTPLVSTDSILMSGLSGQSRSRNLRAFAQVETSFTGGTGTALTVDLIQADNAALTTNVTVIGTSGAIANGSSNVNVAAGRRLLDIPLPEVTQAYLGFRYTSATGAYGAGAITAGLVVGTETPQASRPNAESHGF